MKPLNNKAVSELIGSNLLLLITVATFSIIYISTFALMSTDVSDTSANIICQVEGNNVIFSHLGGDSLPLDTTITLNDNNGYTQEFSLNDHLKDSYKSDGLWNVGEQLIYESQELTGSSLDVNIIHSHQNKLVLKTTLPASNPIITKVNSIYPFIQTSSPMTITASSTGIDPDNISLYYQWQGYWHDDFKNNNAFVYFAQNMSFDQGDYVTVNKSGEGTNIKDYVDTVNVAIDGVSDIGSHSDFSAQKNGPDGVYDTLKEENTGSTTTILSDGFEGNPWDENWDDSGNTPWNRVSDETHSGSNAAYCEYSNQGDLISDDLSTVDAEAVKIEFWYMLDGDIEEEDILLYYYDGNNWDYISYLGGGDEEQWLKYSDTITDSQYFKSNFKICITGSQSWYGEEIWVDDVTIKKASILLQDGFEESNWDNYWEDDGHDWQRDNNPRHSGSYSASARNDNEGTFTCDPLDTSDATTVYVEFWFRKDDIEGDEYTLYYYNGATYNLIDELDNNGYDDQWIHFTDTITDSQYFINDFRIRLDATLNRNNENVWLDDILILKESPDVINYEILLEHQWNSVEYSLENEMLCIKTGSFSSETVYVDIWNTTLGSWDLLFTLNQNAWNNITISNWLKSSTVTIRYRGGVESSDFNQDTWNIDAALLHLWTPGQMIYYEGHITSIQFTKQGSTGWDKFFASVNNTDDSTFSILDETGTPLLTGLVGNGDDISSITDNTIYLFGEFSGATRLDDWMVTRKLSAWTLYDTDTTSADWSWEFSFPDRGNYWFYSIGEKEGWMKEQPPQSPTHDTTCSYEP